MHGFAVLTQTTGDPFEAALFRRADPVIQLVGQSFLIMVEKDLIRSTAWTMGDDRSSSAVTNRRSSAVCLSGSPMSRRATLRVLGADTADPWDSLTGRRRLTGGSSRRPSPSQTEGEQGARIMRSSSADRAELPFPVLPIPLCPNLSRVRAPRAADGKAGSPGPSCQMAARRKDRRVTDRRRQRRRGDRPNARNRHQPLAHCVRPGLRRQPGVELPDPALGVAQLVEYPALRAIPNLAAVSTLTRSLRERSASRSRRRALTSRCRLPLGRQAQRRPGPPRPHAPAGSPGPRP
jgi:hypothetical protein